MNSDEKEQLTSFPSSLTCNPEASLAVYNPADDETITLQPFWLVYV